MASSNDDDFQVVFSIKAVLHAEEEVDCQREGPDSLKTIGDLFSTMSSATTDTLKDFSASLVQAIRSITHTVYSSREIQASVLYLS